MRVILTSILSLLVLCSLGSMQGGLLARAQKFDAVAILQDHEESNAKRIAKEAEAGVAFLARKASEDGWVQHPSGLLFKIKKSGPKSSPRPGLTDLCTVHYKGQLAVSENQGYVFDSSYRRRAPIVCSPDSVIRGWRVALRMMRPGDEWQVRE